MKTMKCSRLSALLLSGVLMAVLPLNVMASSHEVVLNDSGSTTLNTSTNEYSSTLTSGNSAMEGEIEVQAKTSGGVEIVYNIVISHGDMRFDYSYGKSWNPTFHQYTGSGTEGWDTSYIDGTNNQITITNNSNFPVDVGLVYDDTTGTPLNADKTATGSVIGIFAKDIRSFTPAILAEGQGGSLSSSVYKGEYPANTSTNPGSKIHLNMDASSISAGEKYYFTSHDSTGADTLAGRGNKETVYFALSGKPDPQGPTSFVKIGSIKVTVTPAASASRRDR